MSSFLSTAFLLRVAVVVYVHMSANALPQVNPAKSRIVPFVSMNVFLSTPKAAPRRLQTETTQPNIIVFVIDDMPFLKQYNESAPIGVDLANYTVEYGDYPTPNINAFRNEAVIFPKSYCGGPKCSPSRYSVLTGRQPSRSEWAINETLKTGNVSEGTDVTVLSSKLSGYDTVYNLPRVLQDNGYYTGTVGKWHLMPSDDNGHNIGCDALETAARPLLYADCTEIVEEQGFDFVDGWFYSNIEDQEGDFSHNPEWMVSRSQAFIDEAVDDEDKPFFLYFASTLVHGINVDIHNALTERDYTETPKGTLCVFGWFGNEQRVNTLTLSHSPLERF